MVVSPGLEVGFALLWAFGICGGVSVLQSISLRPFRWKCLAATLTRLLELAFGCWLAYGTWSDLAYMLSAEQLAPQYARVLGSAGFVGILLMVHAVTPVLWREHRA